jgi:group I intron endonuclease
MDDLTRSGIYVIKNLLNNKIYIGSATNFKNRWKAHKSHLSNGKHHSIYLQRAWDKYGEANFLFEILELVDKDELITVEQSWLDRTKCYESTIGYNMSKFAGSRKGVKATEETKKKMSASQKGNKNSLGHKHSDVSKQKMKENKDYTRTDEFKEMRRNHTRGENNPTARLTEAKVLDIRRLVKEGKSSTFIAKQFGITVQMVYSIKTYRTWKHVS